MIIYSGSLKRGVVRFDGRDRRPLDPRTDIINHSPTGFAWGYSGSGPAQLALAILVDALGDERWAERLHHEFKRRVVANWPPDADWTITSDEVRRIAREIAHSFGELCSLGEEGETP